MGGERTFTCQAILFDLDGTLVDSTAHLDRLWRWWAERHGMVFDQLRGIVHGRSAAESIRLIAPHLPLAEELESMESEEVAGMVDVKLVDGARQLLAALDPARWAIVTSGSLRVAGARIQHVELPCPNTVITADVVEHGKPAPDGYLLAAHKLGLLPADCIVVEDSPVGIASGKAAGMPVIAIASTHPLDSLQAADVVIPDLAHLLVRPMPSGFSITVTS